MDFYYMEVCSACRAVMMTAKAVGVTLNKKVMDLLKGEQNTPEFLAINFQHSVPTLVDGDLTLWESRAICTYLISKYGKDSQLYPKDPKQRALVDRLLYFDGCSLYPRLLEYAYPILMSGQQPDKEKEAKLQETLGYLNKYLAANDFAAGKQLTVADICLAATVSTVVSAGIDVSKHSNVIGWLERCQKKIPGYETENVPGAKAYENMIKKKLGNK